MAGESCLVGCKPCVHLLRRSRATAPPLGPGGGPGRWRGWMSVQKLQGNPVLRDQEARGLAGEAQGDERV